MKDTLKRLLKYITVRYRFFFLITILCVVVSALTSVAAYAYLSALVDRYITPLIDMEDKAAGFAALARALMILIAIFASGVLAQLIQARSVARMTHGTMYDLRRELFEKMERFPAKYFDTHARGEIMSVYTNDTDAIRQMISQGIPNIISALITVVAILAALLYLNIPLSLLSVVMVALVMGVSMKIIGSAKSCYSEQQENLGNLNGYVEEIFSGQKVVKVFHREERCVEEFRVKNEELRKSAYQASKYTGIVSAVNMQAGNIVFYFLFAVLCSIFVINGWGGMTIGKTIAFLSLSKTMNVPVVLASGQIYSCVTALAGAKRIFEMIDEKSEEDSGTERISPADVKGRVELQNVNFSYVPGTQILYDINITAEPGQKIAIVGSTGSGKTTITNLLNRFYDLDSGKILLDGRDIREYRKEDLRKLIGIVLQDTHLFTGSIYDNIRYGNPGLSDEECIEAAKNARADDFITRLPDGYETVLSRDAENLAEGQRQLLNIARAVAADAPILILDEATSSVDPGTEKLIQEGMDNLMKGRTSFVIAHRLSTIRNSDLILVLDHGRILECGSHDELIKKRGAYYSLYKGV
ncbi:MAG: ABC transporter ATP-binding protein/permease [Lachnospiraceae bacterium]|nr:ABC transporter ATP-binding protein/permease [Lachnospiraceae bacterium]